MIYLECNLRRMLIVARHTAMALLMKPKLVFLLNIITSGQLNTCAMSHKEQIQLEYFL